MSDVILELDDCIEEEKEGLEIESFQASAGALSFNDPIDEQSHFTSDAAEDISSIDLESSRLLSSDDIVIQKVVKRLSAG